MRQVHNNTPQRSAVCTPHNVLICVFSRNKIPRAAVPRA